MITEIRKLFKRDYENLKHLICQVHELHSKNKPDIYVDGEVLPINYFKELINTEDSYSYVFEEDYKFCGLLMATKKVNHYTPVTNQRTTYYIEDIVADKNYRRRGIGKQLYSYLLEQAKKENIDSVELHVWAFNESANKFYESLGMSVKNMKLEQLLNTKIIETKNINLKITKLVGE